MPVDHFKFWRANLVQVNNIKVRLDGQFDPAPWEADVTDLAYIGNPVEKKGKSSGDGTVHLTAYLINTSEMPKPPEWVEFRNQFQKRARWVLKPNMQHLLLVPACKSLDTMPVKLPELNGDHYVCYPVRGLPFPVRDTIPKEVELSDQIDRKIGKPEILKTLTPAYFCVPVSKNDEKVRFPKIHLAIYRFTPETKDTRKVYTLDQFGARTSVLIGSEMLAVPSAKLKFEGMGQES